MATIGYAVERLVMEIDDPEDDTLLFLTDY